MKFPIVTFIALFCSGLSFNEVVERLANHPAVIAFDSQASAQQAASQRLASWGDPMLKVAGKNLFTIELGVSQRFPLTSKYRLLGEVSKALQQKASHNAEHNKRLLVKRLWQIVITMRELTASRVILEENRGWLIKALRISQQLYANAKVEQRAVLALQIRQSELDSQLSSNHRAIQEQLANLSYLVSEQVGSIVDEIPWSILTINNAGNDPQEQALVAQLKAKTVSAEAQQAARIGDLTVSASYSHNIKISQSTMMLAVAMPLPLSAKTSASYQQALHERQRAELMLADYRRNKASELLRYQQQIKRLTSELTILTNTTVPLATDAKRLAFISYKLAKASYHELLQSELKLQALLLRQTSLRAKVAQARLEYKFRNGERLDD